MNVHMKIGDVEMVWKDIPNIKLYRGAGVITFCDSPWVPQATASVSFTSQEWNDILEQSTKS